MCTGLSRLPREPAMADEIVVDLDYVASLRGRVTKTNGRLRSAQPESVSIASDPEMDGELSDFMHRWDKRRGQLADSLKGVEEALTTIHDSFSETDGRLADGLR
jgi:hypothetical protein